MLNIRSADPHAALFTKALAGEFPGVLKLEQCEILDLITAEIIATKNYRLGPAPSPESLVEIRKVLKHYMERHLPIPFMVPWGSEKPDGTGVDLAEVAALKMLRCLNNRVKAHYAPGIVANIRLEDVSAPHLFYWRRDDARREAELYTRGFIELVGLLGIGEFVKPRPESAMVTEEQFNKEADLVLAGVEPYLNAFMASGGGHQVSLFMQASEVGMKGELNMTAVEGYLAQYDKMYQGKDRSFKLHLLARYYAAAVARSNLKIRGDEKHWEGMFIDLSFVPQMRGTEQQFSRRIYYRTVPANITSNHIAPWRAKGYFQLSEDGASACIKLAPHNNLPEELISHVLEFDNGELKTEVGADYVL